jgi:pyruvate dehydrogenase E1 component beta subunit
MPDGRVLSGADAIREALDIALASDPRVFVLGEGVADPKGVFGTTKGLVDRHGRERVVETPVSESAITGMAIGSALLGQRPIVVHQRVEFCLLAIEQLVNNAAKMHYVSNGRQKVPLVVRLIIGRGWGQGAQHSQSLESTFAAVPGLKVVMPVMPHDAKGMLLAAIADDNPVIFFEHRWIHYVTGPVPEGPQASPLDGPRRVRAGEDLTLVASSYMVLEALEAAVALASAGVGVDLFDLRVVRPLNVGPIVESAERTGRLLTVDTGWRSFGVGAEIAARVTEACFTKLKAAPRRIGLPDHSTPSTRALARAFYPTSQEIAGEAAALVGLSGKQVEGIVDEISRGRSDAPFDVPHPAFRGPF